MTAAERMVPARKPEGISRKLDIRGSIGAVWISRMHRKLVILTGSSAEGLREAREVLSISEAFVTVKHLQSFMKARFSEY